MRYLPFEHIIYTTYLSEKEVMDILSRCVRQKKSRIFKNNTVEGYEGSIHGSHFTVSRIVKNRNAFVHRITGTVQQTASETSIEIKMQPDTLISVILIGCCVAVILFLIADLAKSDRDNEDAILAAGMLSGIYLLVMLGFKTESKK